nr:MAG: putative RNA-dependent RNA polymerase [Narnaviridae sp.]
MSVDSASNTRNQPFSATLMCHLERNRKLEASVCPWQHGAAGIQFDAGKVLRRSAGKLVTTITRQVCHELQATDNLRKIIESLIWPFVTRRSQRQEWFSDIEYHRMVSSFKTTGRVIQKYENPNDDHQTFCKYWLNVYLAKYFSAPSLPDKPEWIQEPLFSGWLKRFISRSLVKRDASFFYSLQKGTKMMWPELGEVSKDAALQKHKQRVSQQRGDIPVDIYDTIVAVSTRIFSRACKSDTYTKFIPSGAACYQKSQRHRGSFSLFQPLVLPFKVSHYPHSHDTASSELIGKLPTLAASLNCWRQREWERALEVVEKRVKCYRGIEDLLSVKIIAIPEPGKFRILTKGDGYFYTFLQPIQGSMLSAWKQQKESTMLIGDLTERINEIDQALPELTHWCSVDYEAATDLLKRCASFACLQSLKDSPFFPFLMLAFQRTGKAEYPDGEEVEFCEAQLMGHPLSFPMLCSINLAVYFCAIDRWKDQGLCPEDKPWLSERMKEHVLVNGDDMLFKCLASFEPIFISTAAEVGLKVSVGKNYLSPHSCMINSQLFQRCGGKMVRRGYLNLKLIKGSSLKTGHSHAFPTQIGRELNEMARHCPWVSSSFPYAMERFEKYEKKFGMNFKPNWFLPVHLGGYGLSPQFANPGWKVTRLQRIVAGQFVKDPTSALMRLRSIPIVSRKLIGAVCTWYMVPRKYWNWEPESELWSETHDDGWLQRIALASRASLGPKEFDDRPILRKMALNRGDGALTAEKMAEYWDVKFMSYKPPECPPLAPILLSKMQNITQHWRRLENDGQLVWEAMDEGILCCSPAGSEYLL